MKDTTSRPAAAAGSGANHVRWPSLDGYEVRLRGRSLSDATVKDRMSQAKAFAASMDAAGAAPGALTRGHVSAYWAECGERRSHSSMGNVKAGLAAFLLWLEGEGLAPPGLAASLPPVTGRTARVKSMYSDDEVRQVLAAIDRGSEGGKRDFAMLMLGAAFALRARDVVSLEVGDFDWGRSELTIVLHKTGRLHTVWMPPEVGNAVLDYMLNARPDTADPRLFVASRPPHLGLRGSSACSAALRRRIGLAGVDPAGRSTGFHTFRVRAASGLLAAGEPLPVISEYLGHSGPGSASPYIAADEEGMRSCCLPLPAAMRRGA